MPSRRHRVLTFTTLLVIVSGCNDCPWSNAPETLVNDVAFTEIYSAGLTPASTSSCQGSDGQAVMRIAMRDSDDGPITPDMVLGAFTIDLSTNAIAFSDSALFELPNAQCDQSCSEGFTCDTPPEVYESSYRRCHQASEDLVRATSDPTFVAATDRAQLFGVMLELTNSWRGQLPESITDLHPDLDGDGLGDEGASLALQGFTTDRATDARALRLSLLSSMVANWNAIRLNAQQRYQTETSFGFWTFGASAAKLESRVAALDSTPDDAEFLTSNGRAVAAVASVSGNDGDPEPAAVFESMVAVLESTDGYASPQYADAEKILTVVVDGPDELRLPDLDAERVIAAAQAIDARVFIVHVDTPIQATGINPSTGAEISLFPDDPGYVRAQGAGFATEADCDCKNFEACRAPTRYAAAPGAPVDVPADPGALYCVPEYGEDGRIGPIADYERIACATGGGYIYVPDPGDLLTQADWLPYALDGLWELPVQIAPLADGSVPSGEPYLIQTNLAITLDGENNLYSHFPNPGATTPGDTRAVLFAD